jgi:hypothetical protein
MTGTYTAFRNSEAAMEKLAAIEKSLLRDGLSFETDVTDTQVIIRAHGTPKHHKWRRPAKASCTPLTLEQCQRRLAEAAKQVASFREVFQRRLHDNWNRYEYFTRYQSNRPSQKRIGHAVARILARGKDTSSSRYSKQDYADLDAALGHRARRASQVPKQYYGLLDYMVRAEAHGRADWAERKKKPEPVKREPRKSEIQEYRELKLDVEHWREMVRLSEGDIESLEEAA